MKIYRQSWDFANDVLVSPSVVQAFLDQIERAIRQCYQAEPPQDQAKFIRARIDSGHESVIEHAFFTVHIVTSRKISHQLVRHRLASFSQESTRYCNYSKDKHGNEITVILPNKFYMVPGAMEQNLELDVNNPVHLQYQDWLLGVKSAESSYMQMIEHGAVAEEANDLLPHATKTELVISMNPREWRWFFHERCAKGAHPMMRELAKSILAGFHERIPILFDDRYAQFITVNG